MYDKFEKFGLNDYPVEIRGRFNSFITTQFDDSLSVEMQIRSIIKWAKDNFDETVKQTNNLIGFINDLIAYMNEFIEMFDEKYQETILVKMQEWYDNGELETLINESLDTKYHEMDNRLTSQLTQISVNASLFGDLEVGDARPILQEAIDYAFESGIKKVFIPTGDMFIRSEHPTKTGVGLYVPKGVMLYGISPEETRIFTDIELETLILLEDALSVIKNLRIIGTNQSYVDDNAYYGFRLEQSSGYLLMENVIVQRFKVGFYGELYASVFTKCSFQQNELYGIHLERGTSIVLNAVGVNGSERGYFFDTMVYCTFNSCYGEQVDTAFYIVGSMDIVMNGCGSEFFNRILYGENNINFAVGSIYAGAFGVGGSDENLHDFMFEFHGVESGHFYGTNTQNTAKKGSTLFVNTRKFNYRYGRIIDYNTRFVNSTVNFLDEVGLTTSRDQTFYVDSVMGSDDDIGNSSTLPVKTLSNLIKRLPKNIKHNYNVRIMRDINEPVVFENFEITDGGSLKVWGHDENAPNPRLSELSLYNCNGRIGFDLVDFNETVKTEHVNGTVFNRVNFLNDVENIRTLQSDIQIQNSVFQGAVGVYLDRLSQLYSSNDTGTTTKSIHAQGSLVFLNGTQATGSVVKTAGGQVFSSE